MTDPSRAEPTLPSGTFAVFEEAPTTRIYRLVGEAEWRAAVARGSFAGTEHDVRDGFIHFSAAHQVAVTAAKYYAGRADLFLLHVELAALAQHGARLEWETSRGGELFPHLYGELPTALVLHAEALAVGADGAHVLPDLPR